MNELEEARSALSFLSAECSREEWIQLGMAVKSAGLSFDDFHEWSKHASNYGGEKDCRTVWKSFNESGGITKATLFSFARDKGWRPTKTTALIKVSRIVSTTKTITNLNALDIWERCLPALDSHDYIVKKNGKTDGLRYYPSTEPRLIICGQDVTEHLVVPCWHDEHLQTLQFIPPKEGKKLNLHNASFNDGYFIIGNNLDLIYLCEGIGQAWAINKINNATSAVSFGFGRMKTVAATLRNKHPNAKIIIVPDRGKEEQAAEIAKNVMGYWIELPRENPENYDINDYAKEFGIDAVRKLITSPKLPEMRYKLLSGNDLLNAPPLCWIVQGILPAEGLAAMYGASGSGKSFLVLDMAFAIATGEANWFDYRITKTPVTYIALEGELGLGKRVKAWNIHNNKSVPENLKFVTQSFNLLSNDIPELANAIINNGGKNGLVIIDTLSRSTPGADENSSIDMGNIISAANKLKNLVGGIILFVHHTGKDVTKGLRGHSSLYAALDAAIEVIKTASHREWNVSKSKDDVSGGSHFFKLEKILIDTDEYSSEISSCIIKPDSSTNKTMIKRPNLGANQKIALEEIDKQLDRSVHAGKDGSPILAKCINFDDAILLIAERMPTDAKHKKSSAQTAVTGLVAKNILGFKGSWLWKI